jgi:streptogramin lyase/phosphodiesterase/alkaline phosphatase D-like protein
MVPAGSAQALPTITHYGMPLIGSQPVGVSLGGDGNVWFTEENYDGVGKVTPAGAVTEYYSLTEQPTGITTGSAGNLWFTETGAFGSIGRITTGGFASEFSTGLTWGSNPTAITKGPDGNLWFTEASSGGAIGRITTSGTITEFTSGLTSGSQPFGITAGPDGNLWFTEKAGRIGRVTTQGKITEFSAGISSGAAPQFITAGPDGALWFTEAGTQPRIGRITKNGVVTEYSSGLAGSLGLRGITAGRDGNLYFTERTGSAIGRIATDGTITQFSTGVGSGPYGITSGADGNLWFADLDGGTLGRMTVPPGVTGVTTSGVTNTDVQLSAGITPNSQATTYNFEYGPTTSYGTSTAATPAGSAAAAGTGTASLTGLTPGTTYHVRAVATNPTGTTAGPDHTFTTTLPGAPSATTNDPTGVTSANATMAATVNPQGIAASYHFEWGQTPSFGTSVPQPDASLPVDSADHAVTQGLTGLEPNATYYYRVVATSVSGTTYGDPVTFTTAAVAPDASSNAATSITDSSATLGGTVNPRNSGAGWHFDYGKSATFGSSAPVPDGDLPADDADHTVSQAVTGLEPNTTYHYRLVASSNAGETDDTQRVFKTLAIAPGVTARDASGVSTTGATLAGAVNAHNSDTTYHFEWGETNAYGQSSAATDAEDDNAPHNVSAAVDGLKPDTTYHFRLVAKSDAGETDGPDGTFTTGALAPAATTLDASDVSGEGAMLHGQVDPNRRATTYHFEYGPAGGAAMASTAPLSVGPDGGATDVSSVVSGLDPSTAYSFRLVASSAGGDASGAAMSFTTAAPPPAPAPVPAIGTSVVASPANGTVRYRAPGDSGYTTLSGDAVVPVGSQIDTRAGAINLVTDLGGGKTQKAKFWNGVFTVRQSPKGKGYTDIYVAPATGCKAPAARAAAKKKKPRRNSLWGRDSHGRFRGHGRGSIATVRGTEWLMEERCEGSYTKVKRGKVSVRDLRRHRTVLVRAGHGYLARVKP